MAVKKQEFPTKYYEIADKKKSGWVLDGTKGTSYHQEISTPSILWIPTRGRIAEKQEDGTTKYKEVNYINGCDTLDLEEQKKKGFISKPFEDKIPMENGFMTVVRDGNTIVLYDYLEKVFYNEDTPGRPNTATAIYREVKLDKRAETLLDDDELQTQAKALIYQLRINTGNQKDKYKYNHDRIDAICKMVNVWDETPERKLILLLQKANQDPKEFLNVVVRSEQTVITEVSHALEMNVILFDKNVAMFTEGNKIIFTVEGSEKQATDKKISQVASWLSTEEGNQTLTELRGKLEIAKDKSLQ